MTNIDYNTILNRNSIKTKIQEILVNNNTCKRGIYISGNYGTGKTTFVKNIIKELDYNIMYYDNITNRNKNFIEGFNTNFLDNNVYDMFYKKTKKNIIVLDEIDGINKGDKVALNTLINILKNKYKKNTKNDNIIICINNNINDKKISELIKVSNEFLLNIPSNHEIETIIQIMIPNIFDLSKFNNQHEQLVVFKSNLLKFVNNNLNNINHIVKLYKNNLLYERFLYNDIININNQINIKSITQLLLQNNYYFSNSFFLNDNNKTIIGLLFHENIILLFNKLEFIKKLDIYYKIIDNFSFSDYIDRVIFQKQLWQLNDINYYVKLLYNNFILYNNILLKNIDYQEIIFTKILTKYSNEYNNSIFLNNIYLKLLIEKKDIILLFYYIHKNSLYNEYIKLFENYDISKNDMLRIIKMIC
tara:strand:+ start:4978 stop:6228 length:1251 start_codon:yes stop_codon:yes gene_type:complete